MKRFLVLTAILIFTVGLTGAALGQHRSGNCGHRSGGHGFEGDHHGMRGHKDMGHFGGHCSILGCQKELDLTDDQIAKIKEINFTHQNDMIDLKADLKKARLKLKQTMHSDNPSKGEALAAAAEVNSIQGQIHEARIEHMFALKGVLNKEQLEKWQKCQMSCSGKCGSHCSGGGHSEIPCDPAKCPKHGHGKPGGI
jgi:Spy/CpxP family protein refolding chaperone